MTTYALMKSSRDPERCDREGCAASGVIAADELYVFVWRRKRMGRKRVAITRYHRDCAAGVDVPADTRHIRVSLPAAEMWEKVDQAETGTV